MLRCARQRRRSSLLAMRIENQQDGLRKGKRLNLYSKLLSI